MHSFQSPPQPSAASEAHISRSFSFFLCLLSPGGRQDYNSTTSFSRWAELTKETKKMKKKKQFFLLCEEDDRLLSNFSKKKDFDGCSDRRRFLQEIGLHLHSFHPSAFPSLLLPPQPFFLENYFSFSFVTIEKMCKGAFQCSVAYKS